jgi:hypothetical protein
MRLDTILKKIIPVSFEAKNSLEQLKPIIIRKANDYIVPSGSLPSSGQVQLMQRPVIQEKPKKIFNTKAPEFLPDPYPDVNKKQEYKNTINTIAKVEVAKKQPDLQLILSLSKPEVSLMNESQWGTFLHSYITEEYVYVGERRGMPFYRKRKQIQEALQSTEKKKGFDLNDELLLSYLAWRLEMQILVTDKDKNMRAYPEMHTWYANTPIICICNNAITNIKGSDLYNFIDDWEIGGGKIIWPEIDGKKTDLLAEINSTDVKYAKMKKDELSFVVGKLRCYHMMTSRWATSQMH